ncbi:MAG: hypothetical protein PUE75_05645 [Eubacteriales bacterium]|nr:hypothetical protein [Eubacteriales bacterium]
MKHLIKINLVILTLILMLCGCSAGNQSSEELIHENELSDNADKIFSDMTSFDDIISDTKNIDLYYTPDYDGLTEKIEKDDESATAVRYFYDGDNVVYAKYEGYGEECFDYFTSSESGKKLTVKYIDNNSERYSVDISCDDYSVSFSELDKKDKYDAKFITVTVEAPAENDFPKSVIYTYYKGQVYISEGYYYADDGYHRYCNDGFSTEDAVLYDKVDSVNVNEGLKSILSDYRVCDSEIAVGQHHLEYTQNDDGTKNWFIVADVYAVFDDKFKASEFSEKYGIDVSVSDTDENYWVARFEKTAIPISDSFEDFFEFAKQEFSDYYYCSLIFDKNGRLKELNPSTAKLTYY